jgi:hypothetical protein
MKDEKNTELPGAPIVTDAKTIKEPKPAKPAVQPTVSKAAEKVPEDDTSDDDIAKQSSESLNEEENDDAGTKSKPKGKIRRFFHDWWHNKKARWSTIIGILLLVVGAAVYPNSRYFLLNTAGVRSGASVVVLDNNTRQPLKNVKVQLNNATGETNDDGYVKLEKVRLGSTNLVVTRRAFETQEKKVTVGWGSNPLGDVILEPKGLQYSFVVKDFLSGQPIDKAEAISGDASAFSDKDGKLVLTLDTTSDEPVDIAIKADGYRDEMITETAETTVDKPVNMVPAQQQAFISKRSGKYDLYKVYADGRGEQLVLSGTGFERDDIVLTPQPSGDDVALVSTREGTRSADGNLQSTLNIVNLGSNKVTKLDTGDVVQVEGWVEDTLIYVVVNDQAAAGDAKKQRLVSYNTTTGQKLDIASAPYFNDVIVAGNKVYYAPAREAQVTGEPAANTAVGLYVADPNGTNIKKLQDQEIWTLLRSGYDSITFSTGKDWFEYKFGSAQPSRLNGAPVNQKPRAYTNNANNTQSLWVDERDGKGVLLSYDLGSKQEKVMTGQSGLTYPAHWLNNTTAVYRVNNDNETADYAISINGGAPKKITDVTNTSGIERWYHY